MTPDPDNDSRFQALLASPPESWALVPASEDGEETVLGFLRTAYGRGYVEALANGERREAA